MTPIGFLSGGSHEAGKVRTYGDEMERHKVKVLHEAGSPSARSPRG